MFKKIIYFFLITSILACNNQNVTFLSGKIIKPTNNQIQLLKDEKVIKNIKKDEVIKISDVKLNLPKEVIKAREYQYNLI